jgi:hypothetical protein
MGGVGGSGTRVGATLLRMLGYYLGDDLNDALDNLWFTLLFKRRSILLEGAAEFRELTSLFCARMAGEADVSPSQRERVLRLAASPPRLQHTPEWLALRARSFLGAESTRREDQPCAWKEPNTHVVIERLFEQLPDLCYIHFVRHPLDMALSGNQNQAENWGPVILNHDIKLNPKTSLAYWCAAHRRVQALMRQQPDRVLVVDFDALCAAPDSHFDRVTAFLGISALDDVKASFREYCQTPISAGRRRKISLRKFDADDLTYVASLGYEV